MDALSQFFIELKDLPKGIPHLPVLFVILFWAGFALSAGATLFFGIGSLVLKTVRTVSRNRRF